MTNNLAALRPKLLERFNYDPKTGHFTHKRTALPYHHAGQRAEKQSATDLVLRHDGLHLSCKRVAWLFVTGEWPAGHLTYRDGNPANVSFENLVAVSEVSRGRRTRNCKHCGAAYVAQRVDATAKYCSRACAVAAADKPIPAEVPCKRCGEVLPRRVSGKRPPDREGMHAVPPRARPAQAPSRQVRADRCRSGGDHRRARRALRHLRRGPRHRATG
jgi:hypothetical protein